MVLLGVALAFLEPMPQQQAQLHAIPALLDFRAMMSVQSLSCAQMVHILTWDRVSVRPVKQGPRAMRAPPAAVPVHRVTNARTLTIHRYALWEPTLRGPVMLLARPAPQDTFVQTPRVFRRRAHLERTLHSALKDAKPVHLDMLAPPRMFFL